MRVLNECQKNAMWLVLLSQVADGTGAFPQVGESKTPGNLGVSLESGTVPNIKESASAILKNWMPTTQVNLFLSSRSPFDR
jgi:hypothetical protein